jgi:hypothetical protein
MNPSQAHNLPILAAMNVHVLYRRHGPVVLKSVVKEALAELSLETTPFPNARLLNAMWVELMLSKSGITVELVKHRTASLVMLSSPKGLEELAARMIATAGSKERARLKRVIKKALYGDRIAMAFKNGPRDQSCWLLCHTS